MSRIICQPITPPPRLILFDFDDTLGDYSSARASRLRRAFTPHLREVAGDDFEDVLARMMADSIAQSPHGSDHFPSLFRKFGIESREAAQAAARWYRTNRFFDLVLFEDAVETLAALRCIHDEHGTMDQRRLGIVTNGPTNIQRDKIELMGVTGLVDFVLISEEFGVAKPDPGIFFEAMRLGGASPEETVVIGDAPEFDILGANNAGLRSIWVNRTGAPWPDDHHHPTCEVTNLRSLVDVLGGDQCRDEVTAETQSMH